MVLVFRMGGAGGLSSTSPLSDIFGYAAVTPRLSKHPQAAEENTLTHHASNSWKLFASPLILLPAFLSV